MIRSVEIESADLFIEHPLLQVTIPPVPEGIPAANPDHRIQLEDFKF
jgi:hypothetical protein